MVSLSCILSDYNPKNNIDGNNDGIVECYYFDQYGYMVANTTQDGYMLNADGQWVNNGVVQTKSVEYSASNNDYNAVGTSVDFSDDDSTKTEKNRGTASLLEMDSVYKSLVYKETNRETMRDELWANCLEFYGGGATITYYLDGKYDSLSFSYAPKKGFSVKGDCTLHVYGDDDTILWESDPISSKDKTKSATVDISGQDEIRLHTNRENSYISHID